MKGVHFVVPEGIDDPARPSGGNSYDRRVRDGLAAAGWSVREHPLPGEWPYPDAPGRARLAHLLAGLPDGTTVLVDGLIAATVPEILVPAADRLRLVVLVHMPLGDGVHVPLGEAAPAGATGSAAAERAVLSAAATVVATSAWTARRLVARYALPPDRVHVAEPGVDAADPAPGTGGGRELLCVAAVTPHKGHDTLVAALATVADRDWRCTCVGALDRDPGFADRIRATAPAGRVRFTGVLTGADLDGAYAAADVLVVASRTETYGMVVTEALARGLPVIATEVGGVPEALGHGTGGARPGLLVPPGDPAALATALRRWLDDADLRDRLRRAATDRRATLASWSQTSASVARALVAACAAPVGAP